MRRYLVVINAFAGTCDRWPDLTGRIQRALGHGRDARVDVVRTNGPRDARRAILRGGRDCWDAVVAVGGDGTHHWILDDLAGGPTPLGLIPLGTANDLALQHGIPKSVEAACEVVRGGQIARVDLVRAAGKRFATAGGVGLATDIALGVCAKRQVCLLRGVLRSLGAWAYPLQTVASALLSRRLWRDFTIETVEGEARRLSGPMVLFVNQEVLGGHFHPAPGARNDDGLFEVVLFRRAAGRAQRLRMLGSMLRTLNGSHEGRADIEVLRTRGLTLRSPTPARLFADGELVAEDTRIDLAIESAALPLIVPKNQAGAASHPRPAIVRSLEGDAHDCVVDRSDWVRGGRGAAQATEAA